MRFFRFFNTIKYLRLSQIFYRVKAKLSSKKKSTYKNVKFKKIILFNPSLHSSKEYLKRFDFFDNKIKILNQWVELEYKNLYDYSPLVRFNIEYFEYFIVLAQKGLPFSFFKERWNSYINASLPLHPYVVSLQIVNWIIVQNIYQVYDQTIFDEIYCRYRWLLKHQEKHLLANHYFENLKAIILASFIFEEKKVFQNHLSLLKKECDEEILKDGLHFELSPMYDKLILEDLLLIQTVDKSPWINDFISKMCFSIALLEKGFNRTPLFNDSGDNVAKSVDSLCDACCFSNEVLKQKNWSFLDSGFFKILDNGIAIIVDAGEAGPTYNPGHAHCDCLSFEIFKNGLPLFVNSGTYQYQGELRSSFRSTEAHNTFMVAGHQQSECWGEHRVGKRIRKPTGSLINNTFVGSFINQFGEKNSRILEYIDNELTVLDWVEGVKDGVEVNSFLHLAPGYHFRNGMIIGNDETYSLRTIDCAVRTLNSMYSPEFGKYEDNECLVFEWKNDNNKHGYSIKLFN